MTTKTITYSAGETYNLGNFNSLRRDVSVTIEIKEGDNAEEKWQKLQETVDKKLAIQMQKGGKR